MTGNKENVSPTPPEDPMESKNVESKGDIFSRDGHLTEITVNRLLANELEAGAVDSHLTGCQVCSRRVEALRAEDAAFLQSPLGQPAWLDELARGDEGAAPVVDLAERRRTDAGSRADARPSTGGNAVVWLGGLVAMAAAVALVATFAFDGDGGAPLVEPDDGIRLKGRAFNMEVYANSGEETRHVGTGEAVFPGERVGFKIYPRAAGHAMILGIDDKGNGYQCYPRGASKVSAPIEAKPEGIELDAAMKLDQVLGTERLVAVRCPEPFTYAELAPKLKEQASEAGSQPVGQLKAGCDQHEVRLIKQAPKTP